MESPHLHSQLEPTVAPVLPESLDELVHFCELHGRHGHGKFAWCVCMGWRMPASELQESTPVMRQDALYGLVGDGVPVGVIAAVDGEPIGWCSVAPRHTYRALERSRSIPRLDGVDVWSVVCFFGDPPFRRQRITRRLLEGALAYAASCGAAVVEGYPVEPGTRSYAYTGAPSGTSRRSDPCASWMRAAKTR